MKMILKNFVIEEDGLNTVEIALILAILIALALIFKGKIEEFLNTFLNKVIDKSESIL